MSEENFYQQVVDFLAAVEQASGLKLDEWLSSYSIAQAVHIDIDPAMEAIVKTELQIKERVVVDLRELVEVAAPVEGDNLFITFKAGSAHFHGINADTFGIHMTRQVSAGELEETLRSGAFVPGAEVAQVRQLIVYVLSPTGEINLAKTGVMIGLNAQGRLVSYQTFELNPELTEAHLNPPSQVSNSDQQVILYIFLALTAFMAVNQGEAPLVWRPDGMAVIG